MEIHDKIKYIKNWIKGYAINNNFSNLVIGISGGIDSALTSTLSCMTEHNVHVLNMPIHSANKNTQNSRKIRKYHEKCRPRTPQAARTRHPGGPGGGRHPHMQRSLPLRPWARGAIYMGMNYLLD